MTMISMTTGAATKAEPRRLREGTNNKRQRPGMAKTGTIAAPMKAVIFERFAILGLTEPSRRSNLEKGG